MEGNNNKSLNTEASTSSGTEASNQADQPMSTSAEETSENKNLINLTIKTPKEKENVSIDAGSTVKNVCHSRSFST